MDTRAGAAVGVAIGVRTGAAVVVAGVAADGIDIAVDDTAAAVGSFSS